MSNPDSTSNPATKKVKAAVDGMIERMLQGLVASGGLGEWEAAISGYLERH